MKKQQKNKIKKYFYNLYFILTIICVCFFILGFYLILSVHNMSEYPPFERYTMNFYLLDENDSAVDVSNAQFSYNFEKNLANLGFTPNKDLKRVIIHISKEIEGNIEVIRIEPNKRIPLNVNFPEHKNTNGKITILFEEETKGSSHI